MAEDPEKQARARVGCVLDDKWTLERLLGTGGMAAVYAARHRNGARAAVKVLHADLSRYNEVRERFLREGYAANRVEHPGAVKVLDDDVVVSGPESGTAYLVMELLEGESLQERIERTPPVSELEFLAIAGSVLEVLEAAHARGVVHRDLKPENLFLVGFAGAAASGGAARPAGLDGAFVPDRVKILDFGLARLVLQGQAITSYGLALGTPSFMSPEQAAGRIDEIDGRTDLFALAATGFRIVTGRRIHEAANPIELVGKMAQLAAPSVQTVRPDVSEPYARIIDRALQFRREDRYETAAAMRDDVKRAIAELEGRGPTMFALEPASLGRRSAPADEQTTLEIDDDGALRRPSPLPMADEGMRATEESIRLPRKGSVLPWLALAVAVGVGGEMWLRHRPPRVAESAAAIGGRPAFPSASPVPFAPIPTLSATAVAPGSSPYRDSGVDGAYGAGPDAASQGLVGGRSGEPFGGPPAGARRVPAGKVGPANVHKLPRKHHATQRRPAKSGP